MSQKSEGRLITVFLDLDLAKEFDAAVLHEVRANGKPPVVRNNMLNDAVRDYLRNRSPK